MGKNYSFRILAFVIIVIVFTVGAGAAVTVSKISSPNASILYGNPAIYGNTVVWQDNRNGNYALYTYDAISGTESRISFNDVSNQIYPAIYKDNVVYQDDREFFTYDIYLYNITTGVTTQITNDPMNDQIIPAVYGSRIVWCDNRDDGVNYQIYTNGTSPGTEFAISPAIGFNQLHPQIYGNIVVWEDYRNSNPDIYLYDLSTRRETRITDNTGSQTYPVVFGNRIAWTDNRNVRNEIFINGTSPGLEYSITPDSLNSDHTSPSMYGLKIVWVQDGSSIFMNDTGLSRGIPTPVDTIPGSVPSLPKITRDTTYGDRVVWEDDQNGREIFMYTEGGPGTCPTVDFMNNYRGGSAQVSVRFTDTSA
jgi:beta propeller repeat protein